MILEFNKENIKFCAKQLRLGKVVSFPTETVYGLGANALNEKAVEEIYKLKKRPSNNPLIVHIYDIKQIEEFCVLKPFQEKLIEKLKVFWPGPLSLVLPKKDIIPDIVSARKESIAIRMPNHKVALSLFKEANLPIVAPSANISGFLSPTTALHVQEAFKEKNIPVLQGGNCAVGLESTVLSLLKDTPIILRHGFITKEKLEDTLSEYILDGTEKENNLSSEILSPGMLLKHYSPRTPLYLKSEKLPKSSNASYIAFVDDENELLEETKNKFKEIAYLTSDKTIIAKKLFYILHKFDKMGFDYIVIDSCEEIGLGKAIMDRIKRATNKTNNNN